MPLFPYFKGKISSNPFEIYFRQSSCWIQSWLRTTGQRERVFAQRIAAGRRLQNISSTQFRNGVTVPIPCIRIVLEWLKHGLSNECHTGIYLTVVAQTYTRWHLPIIPGLTSISTTPNMAVTAKLTKGTVVTPTPLLCTVKFFSTGILFLLSGFCCMSYRIFVQIRSSAFCTALAYVWIILGMHPSNQRRRYNIRSSLIETIPRMICGVDSCDTFTDILRCYWWKLGAKWLLQFLWCNNEAYGPNLPISNKQSQ